LIPLRHVKFISSFLDQVFLLLFLPVEILAKKFDYIVVEPATSPIGLFLKPFARLLRFKLVLDIRSTPLASKNDLREDVHKWLFDFSVLVAKNYFDGITILTESMKKQLLQEFGISGSFVGVWTSGVSKSFLAKSDYDIAALRKRFGVENKFVVFHHGTLGYARLDGIMSTIESVAILRDHFDDLVLFLLGDGEGLPKLRKAVEVYGLDDTVIFHEKVHYAEVPQFISMCDVGIVPLSDSPNWRHQCPLKLLEYLAMGKVTIVTDILANREVIKDNKCGIYARSISPQDLANAIEYAHAHRNDLISWGLRGREIIEQRYTWDKIAEDFITFIERDANVRRVDA